jgi:hypothetical protein
MRTASAGGLLVTVTSPQDFDYRRSRCSTAPDPRPTNARCRNRAQNVVRASDGLLSCAIRKRILADAAPRRWRHARFQVRHPIAQHDGRYTAQLGEALGQQRQRGLPRLVIGEAHEPIAAPRQYAQKISRPASVAQSMTMCSPGTGTHGRYVRRCRFRAALAVATARRWLCAEPV